MALAAFSSLFRPGAAAGSDFPAVEKIFAQHCYDCHSVNDPEAGFVMETFDLLMQGGESGPSILPGKSNESLLVHFIEGAVEQDGKKKIMPPGKRKKLTPGEIDAIRSWIDAGARGPVEGESLVRELNVPKIQPRVPPINGIGVLAYTSTAKLLALGKFGEVELRHSDTRGAVRTLPGHRGQVNGIAFSADRREVFAAAGESGLSGEVRQWNMAEGKLVRIFEGHRDTIYAVAVSPDGRILATGGYDQQIKLWDIGSGKEIRTLPGHNAAVFGLAFRKDGKILASASADRTVKLWDVTTGERRDTFGQPLKEQYAVAFSPDGRRLIAGGADNRIRVWEISAQAAEGSNPILLSRYAHEGAILRLVFSPDGATLLSSADDRTVKVWDAIELKERLLLEKQPDWPTGLAFAAEYKGVAVGRSDGTLEVYNIADGKPLPLPKPGLSAIEPRGIQRGVEAKIKLSGTLLSGVTEVRFSTPKLKGELLSQSNASDTEAWIKVLAEPDLVRGAYDISVANGNGESEKRKLYVDDLPQAYEEVLPAQPGDSLKAGHQLARENAPVAPVVGTPVSFWGTIDPAGDVDAVAFEAMTGQTLVFDLAASGIGSKANAVLTLVDDEGKVLAASGRFDDSVDPLLHYTFARTGRYSIRVHDWMAGASQEHFYRLSMGELPVVTGFFPLSVAAGSETDIQLAGFNLPDGHTLKVQADKSGEMNLPLDMEQFRARKTFKLLVTDDIELIEAEPNDEISQAMMLPVPSVVGGRIWRPERRAPALPAGPSASREAETHGTERVDVDHFKFDAKAGRKLVIETSAARRGSPVDTRIEILHADGRPVERLLLQAVRDSQINFRPIDSNTGDIRVENWEEMELNELMYLNGEVCKIFRMPEGPDSGFQFYRNGGRRICYFNTSPTAHALHEFTYIVEPHPPGAKLVANGLPVFAVHYENDDDGWRKSGTDSRVDFTAPADGTYVIRVTDTRGHGGDRFAYRLIVRESKPDFNVTLGGANPTIAPGSGQDFTLTAERIDEFDGDITVEFSNVPAGFLISSPIVIQAGHLQAFGTINAAAEAVAPMKKHSITVTASAMIDGLAVSKDVNRFGTIKLGEKPKLLIALEPYDPVNTNFVARAITDPPLEITIAPGQTVPAWIKVDRRGHDELVTFGVNNLPHGVIVDNIGLNGVLIAKDENYRQIFLRAARWVPETERLCVLQARQVDKPTSLPVLIKVRKPPAPQTASTQ